MRADAGLTTDDPFRPGVFTTGTLPAAASAGAGAIAYDSTLEQPVWSDGTTWNTPPAGGSASFVSTAIWGLD